MYRNRVVPVILIFLVALALYGGSTQIVSDSGAEDALCAGCNIVMFTVEPLRTSHVGAYGYERNTTPHVDRFAQRATIFNRSFTSSSKDVNGFVSLFTGLYYPQHFLWRGNAKTYADTDRFMTFVEALNRSGYHTVAIVDGAHTSTAYHFDRGFDRYLQVGSVSEREIALVEQVLSRGKEPYFLWYQSFEPHEGYAPPEPYALMFDGADRRFLNQTKRMRHRYFEEWENLSGTVPGQGASTASEVKWDSWFFDRMEENASFRKHAIAQYDAEVRRADDQIGRIMSVLDKYSAEEDTITLFTSVQGENFFEHKNFTDKGGDLNGGGHGRVINENIRVPLIIDIPGMRQNGSVSDVYVQNTDIGTTLLDLVGVDHTPYQRQSNGYSLVSYFREGTFNRPFILTGASIQMTFINTTTEMKYLVEGRRGEAVFNLSRDFSETRPILPENGSNLFSNKPAIVDPATFSQVKQQAIRAYEHMDVVWGETQDVRKNFRPNVISQLYPER